MNNHIKLLLTGAVLSALPGLAVSAEPPAAPADYTLLDSIKSGKPMTSFRLRYEKVGQDGLGPAGTSAANNDLK
ncbi:MAG TPA: hypothetical protein VGK14_10865, partial [Novimethylophilus sp.]